MHHAYILYSFTILYSTNEFGLHNKNGNLAILKTF